MWPARYVDRQGPAVGARGIGARRERVEQLEHRVRMLLGIFAAKGVLPLELKPAHTVGDLIVQHLDELEHEAEGKGGVARLLDEHFAKVYRLGRGVPLAA
jgi:hypothetical protein